MPTVNPSDLMTSPSHAGLHTHIFGSEWNNDSAGTTTTILNIRARGAANTKSLIRMMPQGTGEVATGDRSELTWMFEDIDTAIRGWCDIKVRERASDSVRFWHFLTDRNSTGKQADRIVFELDPQNVVTANEFAIVRDAFYDTVEAGSGGSWMFRIVQGSGMTRLENNTIQLVTGNLVLGSDAGDVVPNPSGTVRPFTDNTKDFGTTSFRWKLGHFKDRLFYGVPNSAPTDGDLGNSMVTAYLDQAGNALKFRVRYSDATLKTGSVALV